MIIMNRELIGQREYIKLSMQTSENLRDIMKYIEALKQLEKLENIE